MQIHAARGLTAKDIHMFRADSSDPYFIAKVGRENVNYLATAEY